jgi:G3E family GTPase
VGIDGELLAADGIAVRQVAGGCMCCATGVPSRVALHQLIRQQRPDRILIEPTGLAHPRQILQVFGGRDYAGVLDLRATLCLVDPWSLTEPRFLALPAFHDQIQLADVLVATKADSADPAHLALFHRMAAGLQPPKARVEVIASGQLAWQWLDTPIDSGRRQQLVARTALPLAHQRVVPPVDAAVEPALPCADAEGVTLLVNHQSDSWACGWLFSPEWVFDQAALLALLGNLPVPRIKGVMRSTAGWCSINRMREHCRVEALDAPDTEVPGRLEMIALAPCDWTVIDRALRNCGERRQKVLVAARETL